MAKLTHKHFVNQSNIVGPKRIHGGRRADMAATSYHRTTTGLTGGFKLGSVSSVTIRKQIEMFVIAAMDYHQKH